MCIIIILINLRLSMRNSALQVGYQVQQILNKNLKTIQGLILY